MTDSQTLSLIEKLEALLPNAGEFGPFVAGVETGIKRCIEIAQAQAMPDAHITGKISDELKRCDILDNRAEFERKALENGFVTIRSGDGYFNDALQWCWMFWQHALKQTPKPVSVEECSECHANREARKQEEKLSEQPKCKHGTPSDQECAWCGIRIRDGKVMETHQPVDLPNVSYAKYQIGAFANICHEDRRLMTFGSLLECLWNLHGARETMGYRCAEILAALLDSTPKRESVSLERAAHTIGLHVRPEYLGGWTYRKIAEAVANTWGLKYE